jgi:hypothetical protein
VKAVQLFPASVTFFLTSTMAYQDPYSSNQNYSYNPDYSQPHYNHPNPSTTYPPYDPSGYRSEASSRPVIDQQYSSYSSGVDGVEKRKTQASFVEPPKYVPVASSTSWPAKAWILGIQAK